MKIWELHLKNVKSYGETSVRFHEGVNFISGVNGAGKTTIIESIGFVLFNYLPYTSKEFVREGEQQGEIEILFEGNDERLYRVKRKFSRSQKTVKWEAYDEESGSLLTDIHGSQDMEVWLKPLLGLDLDANLADTFREIIAVDQGLFTAPFLYTEGQRRSLFDKVLKVEGYREAFRNSAGVERIFSDAIKLLEGELKGLEEQLERLPVVEASLDAKRLELGELEKSWENSRVALDASEVELAQWDALKVQKEELDRSLLAFQEQQARLHGDIEYWRNELRQAEQSMKLLEEAKPSYTTYLQEQSKLKQLEGTKAQKDQWLTEQLQTDREWNNANAWIDGEERAIAERQAELSEREKQREVFYTQWQIDASHSMNQHKQWTLMKEASDSIEYAYEDLIQQLRPTAEGLIEVKNQWVHRQEWEQRLAAAEERLLELDALQSQWNSSADPGLQLSQLQERLGGLEARRETLLQNQKHLLEGKCPIIEEACPSPKVSGDVGGFFEEALRGLQNEKEKLQLELQHCNELLEQRSSIERQIAQLKPFELQKEEAINKLRGIDQCILEVKETLSFAHVENLLHTYKDHVAEYERVAQAWNISLQLNLEKVERETQPAWSQFIALLQNILEGTGGADSTSDRIEQATHVIEKGRGLVEKKLVHLHSWKEDREFILGELKDAETKSRLLDSQQEMMRLEREKDEQLGLELAQRQERLAHRKRDREGLHARLTLWEEKLKPLEQIEVEMDAIRNLLEELEPAFRRYTENQKLAERAPEFGAKLDAMQAELSEVQRSLTHIEKERLDVEAIFTYEKYLAKREEHQAVRDQHISLGVQVKSLQKELSSTQEEWERLKSVEQRVRQRLETKKRKEKALQWTKLIRRVLNDAGEPIADVFRRFISREANRIHREISNENVELRWGEGYELLLVDHVQGRERERVFKQLSGGEQMTAALAIRLALLRYLSDTKLGFFDEPTANLDVQRRQHLSSAIQNGTEGFDQLFVISHDDAFEAMTENTIYLTKDRGAGAMVG